MFAQRTDTAALFPILIVWPVAPLVAIFKFPVNVLNMLLETAGVEESISPANTFGMLTVPCAVG